MAEEMWGKRRMRLEMTIESVIIEIMREKTDSGLSIAVNPRQAILAFTDLIGQVEAGKESEKITIALGRESN